MSNPVISYSVALALIACTNLFEFINNGDYWRFQSLAFSEKLSKKELKAMVSSHCVTINLLHIVAYNAVALASYCVSSKGLDNVELIILGVMILGCFKYYLYNRVLKQVIDTRCSISSNSRILCNSLNWAEMIIMIIAILLVIFR